MTATGDQKEDEPAPLFELDDLGDVVVVHLAARRFVSELLILEVSEPLEALLDEGKSRLVLDFHQVIYLASFFIGKVLTLGKHAARRGGKVALCRYDALHELFASLPRHRPDGLGWFSDLPEAIAWCREKPGDPKPED